MKTQAVRAEDFEGVFAVPPLARRRDPARSLDAQENGKIIRHIEAGGISRFMYGGNAVFYHLTLKEFETALQFTAELAGPETWVIPSVGPSFGRAMEQVAMLRDTPFPAAMFLPVSDPRDNEGVYRGISEFVRLSGKPVIVYLKAENNLGVEQVGRLFRDGSAVGLKYAVVRKNPAEDPFLEAILDAVDRRRVISGIGERPAPVHLLKFGLPGYTTGSGCLAPRTTGRMFERLRHRDEAGALAVREKFLPLEDLRDSWGAIPVLHEAFRLAGVADTGPLPPMLSNLAGERAEKVQVAARALLGHERQGI
ncbi:MAG: dihydrodipicolinate synthase family protein [Planctomycetes bacterium]|nr:dihydrodipicolinate synthase family protein [Planctomycetota bacterium]